MITNQTLWDEYVEKNQDHYGKGCVDTARRVMELLDTPSGLWGLASDSLDIHALIDRASEEAGASGLTGFMAGCVAHMVTTCHEHGEAFKKLWNKAHAMTPEDENREGVINPALLTIETSKDLT